MSILICFLLGLVSARSGVALILAAALLAAVLPVMALILGLLPALMAFMAFNMGVVGNLVGLPQMQRIRSR
ncbi:hypothetical protein [Pelagibacterium limicola]|uniref:hypothetical protein n=1 Tax=Pelagibacterium limicola TaxID=2791022 RepID=UPI0018B015A6|nr:hypothetical protein [Pelagibacterium limicola]